MTGVHQQGWRGAGLLQSKQPGLTTFPGENDHNLRETQPTASHCRPFSSPPLCLSKPAHHWMVTVGSEVSLMFSSWGEWGNSTEHDPAIRQMMHLWSHLLFHRKYEAISLWLLIEYRVLIWYQGRWPREHLFLGSYWLTALPAHVQQYMERVRQALTLLFLSNPYNILLHAPCCHVRLRFSVYSVLFWMKLFILFMPNISAFKWWWSFQFTSFIFILAW